MMRFTHWLSATFVLVLWLRAFEVGDVEASQTNLRQPFEIVKPVESHTKLQLDSEGLAVLRSVHEPVAPVVVIGPYRSGKSFLLNQLLGVACGEGFGVGHTRHTQTKGIWFWGEPVPVFGKANNMRIIYFDTEGFESAGKADVYDDRIFSLSALISSVLIYNLPETIRESDLEKLSFATELAEALFGDVEQVSGEGRSSGGTFDAANMVWVIQRDFLEGNSAQQMLQESLQLVQNPNNDRGMTQVNRVRKSLQRITANSTALGLKQPHLERTKLCELPDDQLHPTYLIQREQLKKIVYAMAKPKIVGGHVMSGAELADLIEKVVGALNQKDIPTAGSILEYFNKELVDKCLNQYKSAMLSLHFPVTEAALQQRHASAERAALDMFDKEKFGNDEVHELAAMKSKLQAAIEVEFGNRRTANMFESTRLCERLEMECEDAIERQQHIALPSLDRFKDKTDACRKAFREQCIGPALPAQEERLDKLWRRELNHFMRDYNDKLFNGLVILALCDILIFRFLVKHYALESLGWIIFVFLQVYPKLYLSGGSMYETRGWRTLVRLWEAMVYNKLFDLMQVGPFLLLIIVGVVLWHTYQRLVNTLSSLSPCCWFCWPWKHKSKRDKKVVVGSNTRDLDV